MNTTTFTATVTAQGATITLERRINGALAGCEPIHSIPLPSQKFGVTWLNNAMEAKGFTVESAWAFEFTQDGLQMEAILSEVQ